MEQAANFLKGEGTKQLIKERIHPMASHAQNGRTPRSPWARGQWKEYLDTEEAILEAIRYVEENPVKEGKPRQAWSFVMPFAGLTRGVFVTYH